MEKPSDRIVLRYPSDLERFYGGEKNVVAFTACDFSDARTGTDSSAQAFVAVKPSMRRGIYIEIGETIAVSDGHSWEGGTVLDAKGRESTKKYWDMVNEGFERISRGAALGAVNFAVNKIGGSYLGENLVQNQYRVSKGEVEINPNTTMIYNASGIRTLSFDFAMKPENVAEAEEIKQIVNYFKYYSRGSVTKGSGGIRFPHLWYIRTSSDEINSIIESGDNESESIYFACTSITPTLHTDVLYHNIYPHRTDLNLEFSEMRVRYRTDE